MCAATAYKINRNPYRQLKFRFFSFSSVFCILSQSDECSCDMCVYLTFDITIITASGLVLAINPSDLRAVCMLQKKKKKNWNFTVVNCKRRFISFYKMCANESVSSLIFSMKWGDWVISMLNFLLSLLFFSFSFSSRFVSSFLSLFSLIIRVYILFFFFSSDFSDEFLFLIH